MTLRKLLPVLLFSLSLSLFAEEPATKVKFYGFVGNEFYYNSRQNEESTDGIMHLFPKPVSLDANNNDINAVPVAELLSVSTRLGIDLTGATIFGAKSSGKIECDFSGTGSTYYLLRIRQSYFKLNWNNTELLLGQTWHPMYGNVYPTTLSQNMGAPFQPYNRSPQLRLKQDITPSISLTAAAIYQMQYTSQGSSGKSNIYQKKAMIPDLFLGFEDKNGNLTFGAGIDVKTIKPSGSLTSLSKIVYLQYADNKLQIKAKTTYGQNLNDLQMVCGYGVSEVNNLTNDTSYTNFNISSTWLNVVYGTKWQFSILGGISKNFGTSDYLYKTLSGKFIAYGYGVNNNTQSLLDRLYRITPEVSYNLPDIRIGLEYDFTSALYGTMNQDGNIKSPYSVNNHRLIASIRYFF